MSVLEIRVRSGIFTIALFCISVLFTANTASSADAVQQVQDKTSDGKVISDSTVVNPKILNGKKDITLGELKEKRAKDASEQTDPDSMIAIPAMLSGKDVTVREVKALQAKDAPNRALSDSTVIIPKTLSGNKDITLGEVKAQREKDASNRAISDSTVVIPKALSGKKDVTLGEVKARQAEEAAKTVNVPPIPNISTDDPGDKGKTVGTN